jgi:hypothetical protein
LASARGWPNGGRIYISQTPPHPVLNIASIGNSVLLSWTLPATKFVLQQNSDLSSANWTDVTANPVLNYTNLHYEVTVPTNSDAMFYRLASRPAAP